AALAAGKFGRRITYAVLCVASIGGALMLYQTNTSYGPYFLFSAFVAGGVTASFYGFFPLYLPELFPTAVRATGQGFAFNFGRIIAAVGGLQTATLIGFFGGSFAKAGSVMAAVYLVGMVIIWLGPETKGKELPARSAARNRQHKPGRGTLQSVGLGRGNDARPHGGRRCPPSIPVKSG
ncbi:MAG: MFS transporter, partial [Verrucomicrobia bacterium]|nr:MFS transporter [Verrucomicrobiota bacterium]